MRTFKQMFASFGPLFLGIIPNVWADHPRDSVRETIGLQGEWQLRLDPPALGIEERYSAADLPDRISLPGTVTGAGFGTPASKKPGHGGPQAVRFYHGRAWYRRECTVPDSWKGKRVTLLLERPKIVTGLWVNERFIGMRSSLAVPHVYDVGGALRPGRNQLVVMVDNGATVKGYQEEPGGPIAGSLQLKGERHCEEKYNGILGRIELEASEPVWIVSIDAYPNVAEHRVRTHVRLNNSLGSDVRGEIIVSTMPKAGATPPVEAKRTITLSPGEKAEEFTLNLESPEPTWSEFSPRLWTVRASVAMSDGSRTLQDTLQVTFGMRQLERDGKRLLLNGTPVFMRGRVDSAVFPLTGHSPMDVEGWREILGKAREYGLNHFRFHSWCPPEAAFQAADEMGFLFHVEPSGTNTGMYDDDPPEAFDYGLAECLRIVEAYGNHPSFGFLSVGGNERLSMGSPYDEVRERRQTMLMARLDKIRKVDPRHLYTSTTHPWTQGRHDDYYVSGWGKASDADGRRVRLYGCNWGGPDMTKGSRFIEDPPETTTDYREELEGIDAPVITHEVGQWAVFPNIAEAGKTRSRPHRALDRDRQPCRPAGNGSPSGQPRPPRPDDRTDCGRMVDQSRRQRCPQTGRHFQSAVERRTGSEPGKRLYERRESCAVGRYAGRQASRALCGLGVLGSG